MPLYSFSLFLPTIIKGLGYSTSQAQLYVPQNDLRLSSLNSYARMTIPPYAIGCVCTILVGWASDRAKLRGPFVMGCALVAIVGYAMLLATSAPGVGYAGAILAACGVFPTVPLMLAWGSGNAGSSLKKAVVIGLQSCIGNLGGYVVYSILLYLFLRLRSICSSFIYRTKDAPHFRLGHGKGLPLFLVGRAR